MELAGNVAKGKALPADVLEQLVMRADGVPLYLEELTKSVLESRLLLEETDRYTLLEPLHALAIPSTLQGVAHRASRSARRGSANSRRLARVIGRVFSYELLGAVSAKTERELDEELEQLTRDRAGVQTRHAAGCQLHLQARAGAGRRLRVAAQAPSDSSCTQRSRTHWRTKFPQSVANRPELLAHHRTEAGHLVAAIPLWRRAGESALAPGRAAGERERTSRKGWR